MRTTVFTSICLLALSLAGCADTKTELALDRKVSQETAVSNRDDLLREFNLLIQDRPDLTDAERSDLVGLRESIVPQAEELRQKSFRLQALLIQDLMADKYDSVEVAQIKTDIRNVEHDRLSLFFETVHDINRIMGRPGSRSEAEDDILDREMMQRMLDLYPF